MKAVFGLNLEEHLRVTDRKIAYPLELCVCALTELGGMQEEGLFRIGGGKCQFNTFYKRYFLRIPSD